jgi:hypothetical protein
MDNALQTENRLADPDGVFRHIIEAHRGLSREESEALNARLVLILANHAGSMTVVREAVALAKKG